MKGIINKIIPFSNVDGPGKRLSISFQGCKFDCLYCHNPETIPIYDLHNVDEYKKIYNESLLVMTVEDVINEIGKVASFIQGITVSGGECTLQWKFLIEIFKAVKEKWPHMTCFVDSNGLIPMWTEDKKELLQVMDKMMLDIKAYTKEDHELMTGISNELVLKNFEYLVQIDKIYEVRTVIVPEILNNEKMVDDISKLIAKFDKNLKYKLIKYRQYGVRKEILQAYTPSQEYMENLKKIAENNGLTDIIIV